MTLFELLALAGMLVVGVLLSVIDAREHRLPNRLTLPLFLTLLLLLTGAAWQLGDWPRLLGAVLGALGMASIYLLLALLPGGMGMGDMKLALSIGLLSAWWSLGCWMLALFLAFAFGALVSIVLLVSRRTRWRANIPFGPCMLLGWMLATVPGLLG